MNSLRTLLFFLITNQLIAQKPKSIYYWGDTGKGHSDLILNSDETYQQRVSDCMYSFITRGTYTKSSDTLILNLQTIIKKTGDGKKRPVDSASSTAVIANRMNKYLIKTDTSIIQLKSYNGIYHGTHLLVKQPLPKRKRR